MTTPAVLKFGGSTFPAPHAYTDLAEALRQRIEDEQRPMAVVVSAMPGDTEKLRTMLHEANPQPQEATVAGLLTLADTTSAHLLATSLHRAGVTATVLAGHQQGLVTDSTFMWAKVEQLDAEPLRRALAEHQVVIVPGGQAADRQGRPTWLGKNSSDLSAVLVAAALGAERCEIHSDVDGVYSADPNAVSGARLLPEVTHDTAALMSLYGAKVLHRRSVRTAKQHGITLVCRHNRAPFPSGTVIGSEGGPAVGVVLNTKSQVLAYDTAAQADLAHSVFHTEGIDTVRLEDGPHLVVVGGYLDIERFQRLHELPAGRALGIPVTEITGSRATTHIADDPEQARQLAQKLHDALPGPTTGIRAL
ncbi:MULTISPECIES: aspartate kinase [unclassified Streptomyces]|uniref:amino acid kinase family protein n=1 Tax=unclassified Streptomyces TaxID=2593676 RepID=UPI00277F2CDF|nr:aspartate kinase [Streptomyces sp. DSM 40167]MDQ0404330.1 aspartate kinase [Streptomyces sp. DSM 40167]